jgi:PLD-like domain
MAGVVTGELVDFARNLLIARIEAARDRVWLVSPFLTHLIAERIQRAAGSCTATERRLLTALEPRSVQVGVLDPNALRSLQVAGFEIASIANLHAKVSLVDSDWGLVGSGNLTGAGLGGESGGNLELGVLLDRVQVASAEKVVGDWWARAKLVGAEEIEEYAALPRIPRAEIGDFGPHIATRDPAALREILAEDQATAASRSYWIDSNYHAPDDEAWWRRDWISGQPAVSYAKGDLIVIYLGKRNGGPQKCPAILRAESSTRHDPEWVVRHRDPEAAERWPNVTETSVIAELPVFSGVELALIGRSGSGLQWGYNHITREEFEAIARAMLSRA